MQQIWPAVPCRVLAQWNHFVQWCSGLTPNFLSPRLPYAVYWRAQLAGDAVSPFPWPQSLCFFSAVWATCGEEIIFLLLSVAFGPSTSISANTRFFVSPSLLCGRFPMFHQLKHLLCIFSLAKWPWPLLPLVAKTSNSVLFIAALFLPFLGISPEIFTFVNWQVLYNISRDGTALTACIFPSVFMARTCS